MPTTHTAPEPPPTRGKFRRSAYPRVASSRPLDPHPRSQGPVMSTAGTPRELARYQLPGGLERALIAQRINGRVAITDTPTSDEGRVYLVERHIESLAAMEALAAEYVADSLQRGEPAILVPAAIARSAR